MTSSFRITGRHVLFGMIGFFLLIIAVNTVFITLALRSFPGEQEEKSYLQGLNYNDRLEARAAQDALGWTVEIDKAERDGDGAIIELIFRNKTEAPVYNLSIDGMLLQPTDNDRDQALTFSPAGEGRYTTYAENVTPGVWMLNARAVSNRNETFELTTKLYFE